MTLISVVIPVFNESEGIEIFHNKYLLAEIKKIKKYSFEIIYINDGSNDNSLEIISNIAKKNKQVKVVDLSRNFGKEIATTAGISFASGNAIIIMDSDGQHPPKLIPEFIKKWENGAQVVIGVRSSNEKEGIVKKYGSRLFYKMLNSISGATMVPKSTDFRLIDKSVQTEFLRFSERNRITRGLIDWLGFRREYISFDSPARIAGKASYKTSQLVSLALNSFISLSLKPLYIFGWVGFIITTISSIIGIFIVIEQIALGDPLNIGFTGSAMLGIFMSFMIGLVLMSQAVMAAYVSHIHTQTQGRPLFVVNRHGSVSLPKEQSK